MKCLSLYLKNLYVSFVLNVNNIFFGALNRYIEFCSNETQFTGSVSFLFPFEENGSWKSSLAVQIIAIIFHRFQVVSTTWWVKSGDFNLENKQSSSQYRKFKDEELEADRCQTLKEEQKKNDRSIKCDRSGRF